MKFIIRPALISDATEILPLARELSFSGTVEEFQRNLQDAISDPTVFTDVALSESGDVSAWAPAEKRNIKTAHWQR
ncbi:MAG: hypothetical protein QM617_14790 [Comamonas sp.]